MWAWLAEFIGRILRHILPEVFKEIKKPKETIFVGGDDALRKKIDDDIANSISGSIDKLPPD